MKIVLVCAPDDGRVTDPEVLKDVEAFGKALRDGSVQQRYIDTGGMAFDSGDQLLEFLVKWTPEAATFLSGALVAWLKSRSRRQVSVEFHANGRVKKVSAQTADEVRELMTTAREQFEAHAPKQKEK